MAVHLEELIEKRNAGRRPGEPRLTWEQVAEDIHTSASLISRHKSGEHRMNYETALRYARYFGVKLAEVDDRFFDAA